MSDSARSMVWTATRRIVAGVAACVGFVLAEPLPAQTVTAPGIDSLHVRALVQPRFDTTSVEGEPDTAWEMRRARIMVRAFAAGWIRGDLEGDFGRGGVRLTDGFVQLDFDPRFSIRAGQFKKPFDTLELVSSRELYSIERSGLPRGIVLPTPNRLSNALRYSNRDLGVEWRGRFGAATLIAGFWNGQGTSAETDDGKQVGARIEYAGPAGWRLIGAWGGIRRSAPEDDPDAEGTWSHGFELAATAGKYGQPGWKALAQAMFGDGEPGEDLPEDADVTFRAFQGHAAYHVAVYDVPYLIGVEPMVRFGWADPDSDVDDDEGSLWTGGLNLYHHPHVKTQIGVDHVRPAEGDGETAFRLQGSLGF